MTQQTLNSFVDRYQCPSCDRDDFDNKRAMRIHHTQAHGESLTQREDRYRCSECGREVPTKQGLSNHISKVHQDRWQELRSDEDGLVLQYLD
jgi:competence CoiA-like predicted nuclease